MLIFGHPREHSQVLKYFDAAQLNRSPKLLGVNNKRGVETKDGWATGVACF
jgi:hypothetical protein